MLRSTLVPLSIPVAFIALCWVDILTSRRAPRLPPPEPLALHAGEEPAMARACIALELVTAADVLRGDALDLGTSVVTSRALQRDLERRLRSLPVPMRERVCAAAPRRSAPRPSSFPALVFSLTGDHEHERKVLQLRSREWDGPGAAAARSDVSVEIYKASKEGVPGRWRPAGPEDAERVAIAARAAWSAEDHAELLLQTLDNALALLRRGDPDCRRHVQAQIALTLDVVDGQYRPNHVRHQLDRPR